MNEREQHFRKLERMYLSAPVNNSLYKGITLHISEEQAGLTLKIKQEFFHAAGSMHGSVYFKMLDDAAFFAVQSLIQDVFVYPFSLNTQLLRPASQGMIRSAGEVKFKSSNLFIADAVLYDEKDKVIGRGSGNFMKSKIALNEEIGYC